MIGKILKFLRERREAKQFLKRLYKRERFCSINQHELFYYGLYNSSCKNCDHSYNYLTDEY
jgi:hypothetical protein